MSIIHKFSVFWLRRGRCIPSGKSFREECFLALFIRNANKWIGLQNDYLEKFVFLTQISVWFYRLKGGNSVCFLQKLSRLQIRLACDHGKCYNVIAIRKCHPGQVHKVSYFLNPEVIAIIKNSMVRKWFALSFDTYVIAVIHWSPRQRASHFFTKQCYRGKKSTGGSITWN